MLHYRIKRDWLRIYTTPGKMDSYETYYNALVQCVKRNWGLLKDEIVKSDWLITLLSTDPSQCVIQNPNIDLCMESAKVERLLAGGIKKSDFINYVVIVLSDIIMPKSGRYCPSEQCAGGGGGTLRYVMAVSKDNPEHKNLIIVCDFCAYSEYKNDELQNMEYKWCPLLKSEWGIEDQNYNRPVPTRRLCTLEEEY